MKKIKNIIISLVCMFFYNALMSQDTVTTSAAINWMSIEEAVRLQQNEPRKIFMDIYTDWCGWCRRMDAQTFSHPVIAKYLNEKYYAVKFNAEQKDSVVFQGVTFFNQNPEGNRSSHDLAVALLQGRMGYPSVVFIDEESKVITNIPGYKTPNDLEPILNFILNNLYISGNWEEFIANFQSEIE
ncbi:MAG: DUF255 domain-containing protein [Bacteroidales bacterium]|nr:DUF255 domain-containing protein [Bacteroidales bacterium]